MKSFVVIAIVIATALANPLSSVVDVGGDDLPADWQLVPDGDGNMHLIDVNHQPIEPHFDAETDVRFYLFTRANRQQPQQIFVNDAAGLRASHFNPALQTRIIIHGWNNDANSGINNLLRDAYLNRGYFNVIVVDWGLGANTNNYLASRNRIDGVGLVVARLCDFLNFNGTPFSSFTLVGHSLGAHTAGIAGKRVTRGRLQNIVALDPAMPLFRMDQPERRVDRNDAVYVEVHHTDTGRLGFDEPIGHSSFYPNWGRGQPGCAPDLTGSCGHSRAWEFFGESILTNSFWATRCEGWHSIQNTECSSTGANQLMGGEPLTRASDGVYFLMTNRRSPFSQGWRA